MAHTMPADHPLKSAESHLRDIASRMESARENFIETAMELGDIDAAEATRLFGLYKKHRVIKLDLAMGRYTVKHGGWLDRQTIRDILATN